VGTLCLHLKKKQVVFQDIHELDTINNTAGNNAQQDVVSTNNMIVDENYVQLTRP